MADSIPDDRKYYESDAEYEKAMNLKNAINTAWNRANETTHLDESTGIIEYSKVFSVEDGMKIRAAADGIDTGNLQYAIYRNAYDAQNEYNGQQEAQQESAGTAIVKSFQSGKQEPVNADNVQTEINNASVEQKSEEPVKEVKGLEKPSTIGNNNNVENEPAKNITEGVKSLLKPGEGYKGEESIEAYKEGLANGVDDPNAYGLSAAEAKAAKTEYEDNAAVEKELSALKENDLDLENPVEEVNAGKHTVIKKPYNGKKPVQESKESEKVIVSKESIENAKNQIENAKKDGHFSSFLKSAYLQIFKAAGGERRIPVEGTKIEGNEYLVQISNKSIGKIISSGYLTEEKLAVINDIDNVVKNATYVGSGEYNSSGKKDNPNTIRYDYFETDAEFNGEPYVVKFDVQVLPGVNKYRTHKVVNEISLTPSASGEARPKRAAQADELSSTETISQKEKDSNSLKLENPIKEEETRWTVSGNPADGESKNLTGFDEKKADEVISEAARDQKVYIPKEKTGSMTIAETQAQKAGVKNAVMFASDEGIKLKGGKEASSGYIPETDTVFVRVNDDKASADQLMASGLVERAIAKGEVDLNEAVNKLKDTVGKLDLFEYVYGGYDSADKSLSAKDKKKLEEEALKKVVADAAAGINRFEGLEEYGKQSEKMYDAISEIAPLIDEKLGGILTEGYKNGSIYDASKSNVDSSVEKIENTIHKYHVNEPKEKVYEAANGIHGIIETASGGLRSGREVQYSNIRTVAEGITDKFVRKGFVDFRGKKLSKDNATAAEEIATFAMILRNPKFETFRVFYTKGDTIVGSNAVTSYLMDGSVTSMEKTAADIIADETDRMNRLGADGYFLLHNHPSGDPNPSNLDIETSEAYRDYIKGFRGHIVIDHNKYTYIDERASVYLPGSINGVHSVNGNSQDYIVNTTNNPYLHQKKFDLNSLADMAKDLVHGNGFSVVVFSDSNGYVRAIQEIQNGFVKSRDFQNYISNRKLDYGSSNAFLLTDSDEVFYGSTTENAYYCKFRLTGVSVSVETV